MRFDKMVKEGWLEKQSRFMRTWRRRWIVLSGNKLYSFKESKNYVDPTEVIDLKVFSSVKSSSDFTGKPNSFDVYSSEMNFSLAAKSTKDKEDWIRAIGKAIVLSRTSSWQNDIDAYGEVKE